MSSCSRLKAAGIKAVVFDFDGTLAALEIDFAAMRARVLALAREYGAGEEAAERYVLETIAAVEDHLAARDREAAGEFSARALALVEEMELAAARQGGLFEATRPALALLKKAGFKLALITRNFQPAVQEVFPDWAEYFAVFLPREAVARVKPDPLHLWTAVQRLGLRPGQVLMAGDHPIDILVGRQAGTLTAGVASGRISRAELEAAGADLTFSHVGELAAYLLAGPGRGNGLDTTGPAGI